MNRIFVCLLVISSTMTMAAQTPPALDPALGITTIPLYDVPPSTTSQDVDGPPTLTVFLPQPGRSNGSAIIVAPGGAYLGLASNLEGRQVADWFTVRGFTAFVLKYRKGPQNLFPIPLQDGQRAIRLVRSFSGHYGFSPDRVGIIGFSAGGHLAASTATLFNPMASQDSAPKTGPADMLSDRPDYVVLGYPWLNAMEPAAGHEITYCSVTKTVTPAQCAAFATSYTPKLHVASNTPPIFIYATSDDQVVPVSASVEFYQAMIKAGAPVEMHLFRHGNHGSGLGTGDPALDRWPDLLEQWLRDLGLLTPITNPPSSH